MKISSGRWKEGYRLYWFMYNTFGRAWNDFKDLIGHPSDPARLTKIVDSIPGYYPEWVEEEVELGDRDSYVACHVCSKQILVRCNVFLRLASGPDWHFDPEDLPEGWSYVIEPYPSLKNLIYCPNHSAVDDERS